MSEEQKPYQHEGTDLPYHNPETMQIQAERSAVSEDISEDTQG